MIKELLTNPGLAIVVVAVVLIITKALKISAWIFKILVIVGIAYVVLNFLCII